MAELTSSSFFLASCSGFSNSILWPLFHYHPGPSIVACSHSQLPDSAH